MHVLAALIPATGVSPSHLAAALACSIQTKFIGTALGVATLDQAVAGAPITVDGVQVIARLALFEDAIPAGGWLTLAVGAAGKSAASVCLDGLSAGATKLNPIDEFTVLVRIQGAVPTRRWNVVAGIRQSGRCAENVHPVGD
jgi:hypothetical protein